MIRRGRGFSPAVLPLRANPPDMVINIMLPPAAYILMNQLYEQGVAPSAKTWLYDGAGISDYPDFWQNVKEVGKHMLAFGLYHPQMKFPKAGDELAAAYKQKTGNEPNRLIYQAADSVLLIAEAIRKAGSTDAKGIVDALKDIKFTGVRGTLTFAKEPGYTFQQWVDVPYVTYQITETEQPLSETVLIQGPGQPLAVDKLVRPAR
mgnify:FL=1